LRTLIATGLSSGSFIRPSSVPTSLRVVLSSLVLYGIVRSGAPDPFEEIWRGEGSYHREHGQERKDG
jgi:hypothetical protein